MLHQTLTSPPINESDQSRDPGRGEQSDDENENAVEESRNDDVRSAESLDVGHAASGLGRHARAAVCFRNTCAGTKLGLCDTGAK